MEFDVKKKAAELFNGTWDLIDLTERTPEQQAEMLHKAHASRYLWGLVGTPKNLATGEWQISRVYALLGFGGPALLHGELCLELTAREGLDAFNMAFAYEAVARAYCVLGDKERAAEYKAKGLAVCPDIADKGDRDYVEGELNGID